MIVTPDTLLRWQQRRFREHWTKLSRRPPGRPPANRHDLDERSQGYWDRVTIPIVATLHPPDTAAQL